MSESEAYEEEVVESDGVTITKRYEADEFPVPAIAFNFESTRGEAVTVHLSDEVPDDVAVEDLGFHPEYGSEYWTIEDDEISFERDIDPGAEYTTVYGIRATGTDNIEQFLTEPTLERVEPPLEDESDLVGDGDDAVKDVISGDADSVPGLEEEEENVETLDLKDPNNEGAVGGNDQPDAVTAESAESAESSEEGGEGESATEADTDSETTEPKHASNGDAAVEISGDTLITALATELREQEVSKDDVKLLRKAFDLAAEDQGSVKARVEKLQKDVSDVIAYTDALEEFLDENGTAQGMIEDFRGDLEEFRNEVDTFESKLDSLEDDVVTADDLAALEGNIDGLESEVEDVSSSVDAVSSDVESVEEDVGDVEDTVEDLDAELEDLQDDLDDVRADVGSGEVDERVEEIEDDIVELKEWREQLSSVIGGE